MNRDEPDAAQYVAALSGTWDPEWVHPLTGGGR